MKIGITADHGGVKQKEKIIKYLQKLNYEVINYGTDTTDSVDYPDYAKKLGEALIREEITFGIAICKTGIGMDIACNKIKGIRSSKPCNKLEAKMSRLHNNCNVLSMGANVPFYKVKSIITTFLNSDFSNEERHIRRIKKLDAN